MEVGYGASTKAILKRKPNKADYTQFKYNRVIILLNSLGKVAQKRKKDDDGAYIFIL